jgi:hypothetical protein
MGKLVLLEPDGKTRDVPLDRPRVTIGRHGDNDVRLPLRAVSARHALVLTVRADSFLQDLGSRNGTRVNGRPVARHLLRDGDRIDIGLQQIVYLADDSAVLASVSARPEAVRAPGGGAAVALPALKVASGPLAERVVPLEHDEMLIGRTGVQVAAIRRGAGGIRVVPVEGPQPPRVNGVAVPPEGLPLAEGDTLEVAATRLVLVVAPRAG